MGKAGELIGMAHASQGVGVSLVPAFTVRRIDDPDRDVHKTDFEPSLDAFYNILPSVTASLTVTVPCSYAPKPAAPLIVRTGILRAENMTRQAQ